MTLEDTIRQSVREEVRSAVREELRAVLAEMKPAAPVAEAMLTVDQVAARVAVKPVTVRGWIKAGKLDAKRAGHRLLVDPKALAAFLAASTVEADHELPADDEHMTLIVDRIDSKRSKR